MMVVPVEISPSFSAGTPSELFEFPFTRIVAPFPDYDVTADGQRFILSERPKEDLARRQLQVITGFRVVP